MISGQWLGFINQVPTQHTTGWQPVVRLTNPADLLEFPLSVFAAGAMKYYSTAWQEFLDAGGTRRAILAWHKLGSEGYGHTGPGPNIFKRVAFLFAASFD